MADRAIDITGESSDEDEIEVVVVDRPTIHRSQQQKAIDLTDTGTDDQNNTIARANTTSTRTTADANFRNCVRVIDLYSDSDDVNESLFQKSPAKRPLYSDVVIVESPRKLTKAINASPPKQTPRSSKDSVTPRKRSHARISASASTLVDLTDLGNDDELTVKATSVPKSPNTIQRKPCPSKVTIQQPPSRTTTTVLATAMAIQPNLTMTIDNTTTSIASLPGSLLNSEAQEITKYTVPNRRSPSPRTKAIKTSVASPLKKNRMSQSPKKDTDALPSSDQKIAPTPSVKSTTSPSEPDDSNDSEDDSSSDSQSSTSMSSDCGRNRKRARRNETPVQRMLRPRSAGKAAVRCKSVLEKQSAIVGSSVTNNSELPEKYEKQSGTVHSAVPATKESPTRNTRNTEKAKLQQLKKSCRTPPKAVPTRESSKQSTSLENTDVQAVPLREHDQSSDQIDDSERSDDSTHESDSTASSLPIFNTDISSPEGGTIRIKWESLISGSNYQHYYKIDGAVRTIPMVHAGESRFFAPRYYGRHRDLFQWVNYKQPHSRELQPNHLSLYIECDTIV
jgi:hypothetical protein